MIRFLYNRLWQSIATLFAIITVTFWIIQAAPGGPFQSERAVSPHIREQMLAAYGLDRPPFAQYTHYLGNLLKGDFGLTTKYEGWTVLEIIGGAFPISLQLGLLGMAFALTLGLPVGIIAAARKNSAADWLPMSISMLGICLPTFVMGPLLALGLGLNLNLFNVAGWYGWSDRVLPSLTLGLFYAAYIARMTRAGMLEVLSRDFVRTARAKGLPDRTVVYKHALRVAILPVITYLGPLAAHLLTGSIVVETVFNIPGAGGFFVHSILNRDGFLLGGVVIIYCALLIVFNLLVDASYALLDRRIRVDA